MGELISQKKRFRVPDHQRDYAWTDEGVGQFLDDIIGSVEAEAPEYFLGLIVLVGPSQGVWEILDGQQRMATTSMVFSALRYHLRRLGCEDDAKQIDTEFLAVRQLGADSSPRLTLNRANHQLFDRLVIGQCDDTELQRQIELATRGTSNWRLALAVKASRDNVGLWISENAASGPSQIQRLYRLSRFLEERAQVVCLEVDSEADAYVIFESLNTRGHDLSVLDLVKNHIFSRAPDNQAVWLNDEWLSMLEALGERDADDFLKVFWTSQRGRVQRGSLYKSLKEAFGTPEAVVELAGGLAPAANIHGALDDSKHPLWAERTPTCRHYVDALKTLRARQTRPILFAALRKGLANDTMDDLLWRLVVLTVRYQTVGRRRTGAIEIACAKIAQAVSEGNFDRVKEIIQPLLPADTEFGQDFLRHSDAQARRVLYMLAALSCSTLPSGYDAGAVEEVLSATSACSAERIARQVSREYASRLGNWVIVGPDIPRDPALNDVRFDVDRIRQRQAQLAAAAVRVWRMG